MNALVTYPKFKGTKAYKVYAYEANTTTAIDTFSDWLCTIKNAWPVVLDNNGEAVIYVKESAKLVYVSDTGDTSNPVWTFDNYFVVQQNLVDGTTIPGTTDNLYRVTSSPVQTVLTDQMLLTMTPDVANATTTPSENFTGTGVNDLNWYGPYSGATSGSVFQVVIDGIAIDPPTTAPGITLPATSGVITAGLHSLVYTFVTATGETLPSPASFQVDMGGSNLLSATGVVAGPAGVTDRKVYMTKAGGSTYYLVGSVGDNSTTTFSVNVADASLTVPAPTTNTTGSGSSGEDTFKWRKDGGSYTTGVPITGGTQSLIEGINVKFYQTMGHTAGDQWSLTVNIPARLNLDGLGVKPIYKNVGGVLVSLDGGDMASGFPALFSWSQSQSAWVLINPSTAATVAAVPHGTVELTWSPWICPAGVLTIWLTGTAPGGGGGGSPTGLGGSAGQWVFKKALAVIPGTSYTNSLGSSGAGGASGDSGIDATDATFGSLLTLTGGAGGASGGGASTPGQDNFFGNGGVTTGGDGGAGDTGAGGGGAGSGSGGAGGPGRFILEW